MKSLVVAALVLLVLLTNSLDSHAASPADALAIRVADACGLADFDQVQSLRFTFNVRKGEMHKERSWVWSPPTDTVTLVPPNAGDQGSTYRRGEVTSELEKIDGWFVNDSYWLLFPLHLAWDSFASRTTSPDLVASPVAGVPCQQLVVSYPSAGGYTPGDVYELYLNDTDQVVEWVYRRAGAAKATRRAAWQQYATVGPLRLSLDRPGDTDDFRVWFTDVAVKVKGSNDWLTAVADK